MKRNIIVTSGFKIRFTHGLREELIDLHALNGKNISENDTPVVSFVGEDLKIIYLL